MSQTIYTGTCRGGPWHGRSHTQVTKPPTRAGIFNLEAPGDVRGSYHFVYTRIGGIWEWGPWQTGPSAS